MPAIGRVMQGGGCMARMFCALLVLAQVVPAEDYRAFSARQKQGYLQAEISPDGRFVAATGMTHRTKKGHLTIWLAESGEVVAWINDFPVSSESLDFSPDGSLLAVGCGDQAVDVFALRVQERLPVWERVERLRNDISRRIPIILKPARFSADGKELASPANRVVNWRSARGSTGILETHSIRLWNVSRLEEPDSVIDFNDGLVLDIHFLDENGNRLLVLSSRIEDSSILSIVDRRERAVVKIFSTDSIEERYGEKAVCMDLSPAFTHVAIGGTGYLRLLDAQTLAESRRLEGHGEKTGCTAVAFSPDGTVLASCGDDHTVRLWDVESGELLAVREQLLPHSIAFSPDGLQLVTCGNGDQIVRLWDVSKLLAAPGIRVESPPENVE